MTFLCNQGIGDIIWALMLVQSVRDTERPGEPIDIKILCGNTQGMIDRRALDFVKAFSFVNSAEMTEGTILHPQKPFTDQNGFANYRPNRWNPDGTFTLISNVWLDRGKRLELGMPQYRVNWNVMDEFRFTKEDFLMEKALSMTPTTKRYCVFYPGPLRGNTQEGHNRGEIWKPEDWIFLVQECCKRGFTVVFVGAIYDLPYYEEKLRPLLLLLQGRCSWLNLIGATSIGACFAVCKGAEFVVAYQAGVGVVSSLMGVPTAIWWRKQGDSVSPYAFFTSHKDMKNAWANPEHLKRRTHWGLTYGEQTADELVQGFEERGWL